MADHPFGFASPTICHQRSNTDVALTRILMEDDAQNTYQNHERRAVFRTGESFHFCEASFVQLKGLTCGSNAEFFLPLSVFLKFKMRQGAGKLLPPIIQLRVQQPLFQQLFFPHSIVGKLDQRPR
jgi:hypothetical protein